MTDQKHTAEVKTIEVKNKPDFQFVSFWGFLTVQLFLLCRYSIFLRSGLSGWQVNEITAIQVQKQGKRKCFLKNFYCIPCISKRVCLTGKIFHMREQPDCVRSFSQMSRWGIGLAVNTGMIWPSKTGRRRFSFHAGKFKYCFASGQRFSWSGREREQAFTDRVCEDKKWRIQPFLKFPASLGCVSLWGADCSSQSVRAVWQLHQSHWSRSLSQLLCQGQSHRLSPFCCVQGIFSKVKFH